MVVSAAVPIAGMATVSPGVKKDLCKDKQSDSLPECNDGSVKEWGDQIIPKRHQKKSEADESCDSNNYEDRSLPIPCTIHGFVIYVVLLKNELIIQVP
jgi:hypothetical protein